MKLKQELQMENKDLVNNPDHYHKERVNITIEPVDLCEQCGFLFGSGLKYLFRYKNKGNPKLDLEKARYYFSRYLNKYDDTTYPNGMGVDLNIFDYSFIYKAFSKKTFLLNTEEFLNKDDPKNLCKHLLNFIDSELKNYEPKEINQNKNKEIKNFPAELFKELNLFFRNNLDGSWYATDFDIGYNPKICMQFIEGKLTTKQSTIAFRLYYTDKSKLKDLDLLNIKNTDRVATSSFHDFRNIEFISWFKKIVEELCK